MITGIDITGSWYFAHKNGKLWRNRYFALIVD